MDRGNAHLFKYLREGRGEGTLFTEGGQYSLVNTVRGGTVFTSEYCPGGNRYSLVIKYVAIVVRCNNLASVQ